MFHVMAEAVDFCKINKIMCLFIYNYYFSFYEL